jgi:hypothetical protein
MKGKTTPSAAAEVSRHFLEAQTPLFAVKQGGEWPPSNSFKPSHRSCKDVPPKTLRHYPAIRLPEVAQALIPVFRLISMDLLFSGKLIRHAVEGLATHRPCFVPRNRNVRRFAAGAARLQSDCCSDRD